MSKDNPTIKPPFIRMDVTKYSNQKNFQCTPEEDLDHAMLGDGINIIATLNAIIQSNNCLIKKLEQEIEKNRAIESFFHYPNTQRHIIINQIRERGKWLFGQSFAPHYFTKKDDDNIFLHGTERYVKSYERGHGNVRIIKKNDFFGVPDWFRHMVNYEIPPNFKINTTKTYKLDHTDKIDQFCRYSLILFNGIRNFNRIEHEQQFDPNPRLENYCNSINFPIIFHSSDKLGVKHVVVCIFSLFRARNIEDLQIVHTDLKNLRHTFELNCFEQILKKCHASCNERQGKIYTKSIVFLLPRDTVGMLSVVGFSKEAMTSIGKDIIKQQEDFCDHTINSKRWNSKSSYDVIYQMRGDKF